MKILSKLVNKIYRSRKRYIWWAKVAIVERLLTLLAAFVGRGNYRRLPKAGL